MPTAPTTQTNAGPTRDQATRAWVGILFQDAEALEVERVDLMERIGVNRDELRAKAKGGYLTPEQKELLEKWYPEKEKGKNRTDEEIAATREVKMEAVKRLTGKAA